MKLHFNNAFLHSPLEDGGMNIRVAVSPDGIVIADGKEFILGKLDCVYFGKGTQTIKFKSKGRKESALLYLLSAPAHHKYSNKILVREKADPVQLGAAETAAAVRLIIDLSGAWQ